MFLQCGRFNKQGFWEREWLRVWLGLLLYISSQLKCFNLDYCLSHDLKREDTKSNSYLAILSYFHHHRILCYNFFPTIISSIVIEYINDMHALFWTLNLASDSLAVWKYIILFGYNFPVFSVLPMTKEPFDKYYT